MKRQPKYITETALRAHIRSKLLNDILITESTELSWSELMDLFTPMTAFLQGVLVPNLKKITKGLMLQIALFAPWKTGKDKRIMLQRYKNDLDEINDEIDENLKEIDKQAGATGTAVKWIFNPGAQFGKVGIDAAKSFHNNFLGGDTRGEAQRDREAEAEVEANTGTIKSFLDQMDALFLLGDAHTRPGKQILEQNEQPDEQAEITQLANDPDFNNKMAEFQAKHLEKIREQSQFVLDTVLAPLEVVSQLAAATDLDAFVSSIMASEIAKKVFDEQKLNELQTGIENGVKQVLADEEQKNEFITAMGKDPTKDKVSDSEITQELRKTLFVEAKKDLQSQLAGIGDGAKLWAQEALMGDIKKEDFPELSATPAGAEYVKIIEETLKKIDSALTSAF